MPESTKVIIAIGMLPLSTNPSVRLALNGIRDYAGFKDTLRENVRFLAEHGGCSHASTNLVDQHAAERDDERIGQYQSWCPDRSAGRPEEGEEGAAEAVVSAMIMTMHNAGPGEDLIMAAVQRFQASGGKGEDSRVSGDPMTGRGPPHRRGTPKTTSAPIATKQGTLTSRAPSCR